MPSTKVLTSILNSDHSRTHTPQLFLLSTLLASTLALPTVFRRSVYLGYNAAGSVTSPQGQKSYEGNLAAGPSVPASSYQCYDGDVANYPSVQSWLSFDALWDVNRDNILSANGGNTYLQHYIHDAILQVAGETNVNARLILALVMQEVHHPSHLPKTPTSNTTTVLRQNLCPLHRPIPQSKLRPDASPLRQHLL